MTIFLLVIMLLQGPDHKPAYYSDIYPSADACQTMMERRMDELSHMRKIDLSQAYGKCIRLDGVGTS